MITVYLKKRLKVIKLTLVRETQQGIVAYYFKNVFLQESDLP